MAALGHMYALPMASAVAMVPMPQALEAGGGLAGHQGGVCKNWCGLPQAQDLRPMQCGVLWFVHISKNGGSTTWDYLKRNAAVNSWKTAEIGAPAYALGGPKQWRWNESDGWRDAQQEMDQKEPKLIVHWHARAEGNGYMMRNHLPQVACEMQAKGCDFQMATMLRDPVDHVTSEMGNQKMNPSVLRSHVATFSNSQVKSLLFNDAENWPSAYKQGDANADIQLIAPASSMIKDFALVGQVEAMGPALHALQQTLGFAEPPDGHQFTSPSAEAPLALFDEDISLIRDSTEVDHLLYNTLCSTAPCSSTHVAPDICRGSKYVHQGGGLRTSLVGMDTAELNMHELHQVTQEANVTDANWAPALGATPAVELKAAGIEAIAQAGVARSALEGAVAAKAELLHATSEEARTELDKKVRTMSAIAEEAEQLAYAAEARAEKVKALLVADPKLGADKTARAEDEAVAQAAVAAASFKAAKTARESLLQLPEEERQVAQIKADGLAAHAETEEKLAFEAEKKAAKMAQAAADKIGGVMAQVEVESTLARADEPEAHQEDDQVPESTAAALAASLAEEALNTARDLRVLKNAHASHEDITNAEAVAAEALAQAEAAEQRAYHASSKTGAQLQDTKLALQPGASNASELLEKTAIEEALTPSEEMAMGVKSFEGLAVQRAKMVAEKRAQKRQADEQLNAANEALKDAHAQEIKLSDIARQAKKQADLAAADKAAKLRSAEMAAADEEMATRDVDKSVSALKQALDNSAVEKTAALKVAVQRAKRTKQRLMTRSQKFDARLKKTAVQNALVKADAGKEVALKEAAVKATLDQQAAIIDAAVEKARQLERAKVALEKSEAVQSAVQSVEDEAKHRVAVMQVETKKLLERANYEKEAAFKESEERIRAAAALARDTAKKITDRNAKNSAKKLKSSTEPQHDAVAETRSSAIEKHSKVSDSKESEMAHSKPNISKVMAIKPKAIKSMEKDSSLANESMANESRISVEQSQISIEGWAAARAAASAREEAELGSAKMLLPPFLAANTSLSATNISLVLDSDSEESAVKAAVVLAEQALTAAKEVRFLRESKAASDSQRKQAESKATALAEQAEAAEAKLQAMEQTAHTSADAFVVDALYHPASVEEAPRPTSTRNSSSSNASTGTKGVPASPAENATIHPLILSANTPASRTVVASFGPEVPSLTEEQQKGLAFAAEASMDAVQKAEMAQSAKNLADPLRKVHREATDAVLKARDQLQTHESSAFHASIKAKQAELEAEMLGKAVAMARSSANARREVVTTSVARAAERHAEAQVARKEATSAQEDSRRALAGATKVAVAKAALDRSKVALSSPAASARDVAGIQQVSSAVMRAQQELQAHESDAAQADLEAKQAQAQAQSLATAATNARHALSANKSVATPSSRHS